MHSNGVLFFLDRTLHAIHQEIYRVLDELTRLLHVAYFLPKLRQSHRRHFLGQHQMLFSLN